MFTYKLSVEVTEAGPETTLDVRRPAGEDYPHGQHVVSVEGGELDELDSLLHDAIRRRDAMLGQVS